MPNPGRHEPQAPSPTLNIGNVGLLDAAETEINPATDTATAIASTGQELDNGGAGTAAATNYTVTVVALASYRVTAVNGVIYLGIADTTTDANVLWTVSAGDTQAITIPSGTALHYRTDTALVTGRLARIV